MPDQPATLAARIRAKYPGVYDDIADIELEQRVSKKFSGVYDDIPRTEASLTRQRQPTGTPSALEAGHHPDAFSREVFGKQVPVRFDGPTGLEDTEFLRRGPEVGGAAGMIVAGPLGAGAGAAAGSLVRDQFERGAHVPTRGELGGAAVQGGKSLALSAVPGLSRVAAERVGPVLVTNAPRISRAVRGATGAGPMAGIGAGLASGNPILGAMTAAASRAATSPQAIRSVGHAATRVGATPMHAVNKAGFGALSAEALRQALLDALAEESPASTVP
jgi:hypothetical protein